MGYKYKDQVCFFPRLSRTDLEVMSEDPGVLFAFALMVSVKLSLLTFLWMVRLRSFADITVASQWQAFVH